MSLSWEDKLARIVAEFASHPEGGRECAITHEFVPGEYVRTIRIPAQTLFIGRKHLRGHRCALVEGEIILCQPQGRRHLRAPFEMVSEPGMHIVLYSITDVVGRTWQPNPEESRDVALLESQAVEPQGALLARGRKLLELPLEILT